MLDAFGVVEDRRLACGEGIEPVRLPKGPLRPVFEPLPFELEFLKSSALTRMFDELPDVLALPPAGSLTEQVTDGRLLPSKRLAQPILLIQCRL